MSAVKVYFNETPAQLISVSQTMIRIAVPIVKSDVNCTISVVIAGDSLIYTDKFAYQKIMTITQIAGDGGRPGCRTGATTGGMAGGSCGRSVTGEFQ
jgi:hypothetical protein